MSEDVRYGDEELKKQYLLLKEENEYQKQQIEKYEKRLAQLKAQLNEKLQEQKKEAPKKQSKGRPGVSAQKKAQVRTLRQQGCTVRQIAERTGLSIGCISGILREHKDYTCKIDFMNKEDCCTTIYVNFTKEEVRVQNWTQDLIHRAFGVLEHPGWEDFQRFLESRCFPRTRDKMKYILKDMGLQSYDPWEIVQITKGRMAEDHQWLRFEEGGADGTQE